MLNFLPISSQPMANEYGVVISQPPEMTNSGNGVFFPCILDMQGVANFPYRYACYFSTDHTSTTDDGIYLYLTNTLAESGEWVSYTDAVTQGDFNYLGSKPSANPIYVDNSAGSQTETPSLNIVNGTIVMTYHNSGVGNNQSTVRATGTDGINFSRDGVVIDYSSGSIEPGDGHTGYFRWTRNPFTDINYEYIGYSLHGGTDAAYYAQWGTDDPVNGAWTKLAVLQSQQGRISSNGWGFEWNGIAVETFKKLRNGNYTALVTMTELASGAAQRDGGIYQVEFDSVGREVVSAPKPVLVLADETAQSLSVSAVGLVPFSHSKYKGVFEATDVSDIKTFRALDIVLGSRFDQLTPVIPDTTEYTFDFTGETSLPAGLVQSQTGTSTVSFGGGGMTMTASDGDEIIIYFNTPFTPNTVGFIEMFCNEFRTTSATKTRQFNLGFASTQVFRDTIQEGFIWGSDGAVGEYVAQGVAGGVSTKYTEAKNLVGYNNNDASSRHQSGFRWFVGDSKLYQLGFGGLEVFSELTAPEVVIDKDIAYYPFISLKSDGGEVTELIESLTIRYGT